MTEAIALVVRSQFLTADLQATISSISSADFRRIYVVVAGVQPSARKESKQDAKDVIPVNHHPRLTVITPQELSKVGEAVDSCPAYRNYLEFILWKKQASKEGIQRIWMAASRQNLGAMMAIAAIAGYDDGVRLCPNADESQVNLGIPAGRILDRLVHPIHKPLPGRAKGGGQDHGLILGESEPIKKLRDEIRSFASLPFPVMLIGETGTGKELCATEIHRLSGRSGRPIFINSALLSEELSASELFGHSKGAFTGANSNRDGRIHEADNGTLFLDELNSMPLGIQARLLRALNNINEARIQYERVGDNKKFDCGVRLITATNQEDVEDASILRVDLLHRVNTLVIHVPRLHERGEDKILLADKFLETLGRQLAMPATPKMEDDALKVIMQYEWPGNVRELKRVMTQACVISRDRNMTKLTAKDIEPLLLRGDKLHASKTTAPKTLEMRIAEWRVAAARYACLNHPSNKAEAARDLGYRTGQELDRMLRSAERFLQTAGKRASAKPRG